MKVYQRQIVELPFNLPQGVRNHPAIILSANEAIEEEDAFVAVMITSEKNNDEYAFQITDAMLETGRFVKSHTEVRLHIMSFFQIKDIIMNSHMNIKLKQATFGRIINHINRVTFKTVG